MKWRGYEIRVEDYPPERKLMATLKIDKGVPTPAEKNTNNELTATARKMEVGDSVLFKGHTLASYRQAKALATQIYRTTINTPYRQAIGKVEEGYRVWKVRR